MNALRIMTFNVRYGTAEDGPNSWPYRRSAALGVATRFRPDILCLQEALDFQIEEFLDALPGFSATGVGRDDGVRAGEHVPILFDTARLNARESGTFWFSDTPDLAASRHPECFHPRICTWIELEDRGERFAIFNLHLDNESGDARIKASAQLLRFIRERPSLPTLVAGDFNAGESDPCVEAMRRGGFRDTFRLRRPNEQSAGTFHAFGYGPSPEKIDYLWIGDGWECEEADIVRERPDGTWPSDHFPVTAIVRLAD